LASQIANLSPTTAHPSEDEQGCPGCPGRRQTPTGGLPLSHGQNSPPVQLMNSEGSPIAPPETPHVAPSAAPSSQ
jgi:hypothetical protein